MLFRYFFKSHTRPPSRNRRKYIRWIVTSHLQQKSEAFEDSKQKYLSFPNFWSFSLVYKMVLNMLISSSQQPTSNLIRDHWGRYTAHQISDYTRSRYHKQSCKWSVRPLFSISRCSLQKESQQAIPLHSLGRVSCYCINAHTQCTDCRIAHSSGSENRIKQIHWSASSLLL